MKADTRIRVGQIAHLKEGQRVFLSVSDDETLSVVVREVICASKKTGQPPRVKIETECGLQAIVPESELLLDAMAEVA